MLNRKDPADQEQATIPLQVNVTRNALFVPDDLSIKPHNWVNVYGPPGAKVACYTSEDKQSYINDGSPQPFYLSLEKTDPNFPGGFGSFTVSYKLATSNQGISDLEAFTVSVNEVSKALGFADGLNDANFNYLIGYNVVTNAPNDGDTPCTIYLLVNPNLDNGKKITYALAEIIDESHAVLRGSEDPKKKSAPLNDDGTVTIDIINSYAEPVSVRVSLPESPDGDSITFGGRSKNPPLEFFKFPN